MLGRLDDDVPAAVGHRYDVLPTHRVGRPQGARTGGSSVVKRRAAMSKSGAVELRSSHLCRQTGGCGVNVAATGRRPGEVRGARAGDARGSEENDGQHYLYAPQRNELRGLSAAPSSPE
jgi:hypothetical protein